MRSDDFCDMMENSPGFLRVSGFSMLKVAGFRRDRYG
jgi:hypothetical protein